MEMFEHTKDPAPRFNDYLRFVNICLTVFPKVMGGRLQTLGFHPLVDTSTAASAENWGTFCNHSNAVIPSGVNGDPLGVPWVPPDTYIVSLLCLLDAFYFIYVCVCIHVHICSWFVHTQKDKLEIFFSKLRLLFVTQSDTILYSKKEQNSIHGWRNLSLLSTLERNDRKQEGNVYFHNFQKKKRSSHFKVQTLTERCSIVLFTS